MRAPRLSQEVGAEVRLKLEGANPTGSFKDRGMTCAVSDAVRNGAEAVVCASTGNTAASLAAYAARAGLRGAVIVPEGKIAAGKLAQALMHGARVARCAATSTRRSSIVRELARRHRSRSSTRSTRCAWRARRRRPSSSSRRLDELDALCIPVGNAGNVTAYWKGFGERGPRRACSASRPRGGAARASGTASSSPRRWPARSASATRRAGRRRWRR